MRRITLAAVTACALLALPASASAATLLASPAGLDEGDCLAAACTLERAVALAVAGDVVRLGAGTYERDHQSIVVNKAITVEGTPGQARPTLDVLSLTTAVTLNGGAVMRNVAIVSASPESCCYRPAVDLRNGAVLEQATVTGGEHTGWGVRLFEGGGTLRDTIVINTADNVSVYGVEAYDTGLIENVTIVSDIGLRTPSDSAITVTVRNSIIVGGETDWTWWGEGNQTAVDLIHTRLSTKASEQGAPEPGGIRDTVRSYDPQLTADGHQTDASPVRDDGTEEWHYTRVDARDVDNRPRILGGTIDIGADEQDAGLHWAGRPYVTRRGSVKSLVGVVVNAVGSSTVDVSFDPGAADDPILFDDLAAGTDLLPDFEIATVPGQEYAMRAVATQDGQPDTSPFGTFTALPRPDTSVSAANFSGDARRPFFAFDADSPEPSTFTCRVDTTDFPGCESPFTVPAGLTDGDHTFTVTATDWSGGADLSPATKAFRIGPPPPVTTPTTATTTTTTTTPGDATPPPVEGLPTGPVVPPVAQVATLAPKVGKPVVRKRHVRLKVTNPNPGAANVVGRLRSGGTVLAKGSRSIAGGASATLVLRLTRQGLKVAKKRRLKGTVTVAIGTAKTTRKLS